jgi:D-arabinose 1-dehydrogenase-like Zn-dependent alcohol dehydrogenase
MDEVGPDAPTLCEGWTTYDLAAHLVLREGSPLAVAGIAFPPTAAWTGCGRG